MSATLSSSRRAIIAVLAVLGAIVTLTAGGVYATLRAEASNATAQQIQSGTLFLTMDAAAFTQSITNLAPGDQRTRYVDLTNSGTLPGRDLTLRVTDSTPSVLTTDPLRGLQVSVVSCSVAWAADGSCATQTPILSTAALSGLTSASSSLVSTLAPGEVRHLRLQVTLPDQVETVVNGVLPANTIQGRSASLTWTFSETQRAATTS